jgi:hypothetical protein
MMERRNLVGGSLAAGLAALAGAPPAAEAAAQRDDNDERVARAVSDLRTSLERQADAPWRAVARIREAQRVWMRATQKFPDFIEIGIGVWEALWDWHVRYQQPLNVTRLPDGRYAMGLMFTTLLLRPDQDVNFVGVAFDGALPPPRV